MQTGESAEIERRAAALAYERWLETFARPGLVDGCCPACGGPAELVETRTGVYVRAPGVSAPRDEPHPAADGWAPELTTD